MSQLGRITPSSAVWAATPKVWAPRIWLGELPRRSPGVRRFRNLRYRNQTIGSCVGQSGAGICETTIRTPVKFTDASKPQQAIDISPLWVYYWARKKTADMGDRSIYSGEGAVVTHALMAMQEQGFIEYKYWPNTEENEKNYYRLWDRKGPPKEALDAPRLKPIEKIAMIKSQTQILEYLAGGYSVWIGVPWSGPLQTGPDGKFNWGGRIIGGHAVELMDYDLDADTVWIGNSWDGAPFGVQPGGIGSTKWSTFSRVLTDSMLERGESEACVFSEVDGWKQKIEIPSWVDAL